MKLAIVGRGKIVQEVLPHLSGWGWDAAAICATPRSEEKGRALAAQCGGARVYTDCAAMLADGGADAVYIASPNALHYDMALRALRAGWNVVVEKPMTGNFRQAEELAALARKEGRFLYEAISTIYQPDYAALRANLPRVGDVKLVSCNFSQYSSRYDAFRRGEVLPAFDPAMAGGALMDLNLYNLHWLVGLFGPPEELAYHANVERGIDTSGAVVLRYPGFRAVSIAAKDCSAPCRYIIQGTAGYLTQCTPANQCGEVTLHLNDGGEERFHTPVEHRMEMEFRAFARQMAAGDLESCYGALEQSLRVSRMLTQARQSAGIRFPED